jgi:transposase
VSFFTREGIKHFIVNPLQSKRAKGTKLRKVKTDAVDAWNLAEMYYRGDVKPHRTWEESYKELQHATRQHEFVTSLYVQAKLNARALLDQVFPQYEAVFYHLYCFTALKILQGCLKVTWEI